jgi:hypothetical protein
MTTTILQPTMRDRESHPCKYCKRIAPVRVCFQTKSEIVTCCCAACANNWLRANFGIATEPFAEDGSLKQTAAQPQHRPVQGIVTR